METKENFKDFKIWFNTLFNIIPVNTIPIDEVLMEFYITALSIPTTMWDKRSNAKTLQGAIDEAVKVENEMISLIACHHTNKESKASESSKKNNGSDNKVAKIKEKDTTNVEGLHQIIKKLMNRVQMGME